MLQMTHLPTPPLPCPLLDGVSRQRSLRTAIPPEEHLSPVGLVQALLGEGWKGAQGEVQHLEVEEETLGKRLTDRQDSDKSTRQAGRDTDRQRDRQTAPSNSGPGLTIGRKAKV